MIRLRIKFKDYSLYFFRFEPKGLPLVFLSKGQMFTNSKSNVLPRMKSLGNSDLPMVTNVLVDLPHYLYSCVGKPGVRTVGQFFDVSSFKMEIEYRLIGPLNVRYLVVNQSRIKLCHHCIFKCQSE